MSVVAIRPDYEAHTVVRDVRANFHGNIVVYVHWEKHLSFCAALAFPLPPGMPFSAFIDDVVKPHYAAHPDAERIDWSAVIWEIDHKKVSPDPGASLEANGVGHKSLVRFWTPGLDGYQGVAG
jgi:phenol hydroxylase P4 protein